MPPKYCSITNLALNKINQASRIGGSALTLSKINEHVNTQPRNASSYTNLANEGERNFYNASPLPKGKLNNGTNVEGSETISSPPLTTVTQTPPTTTQPQPTRSRFAPGTFIKNFFK